MKQKENTSLLWGIRWILTFAIWTISVQIVDVQPVGQNGTSIGFSSLNCWFHAYTGVNMALYLLTDRLGLVPLSVCMLFCGVGILQSVKRKNLFQTDHDIIALGIYYSIILFCYFIFEKFPINYRPIPIEGVMESSYPSSTVLLVLSVMPTLVFQAERRLSNPLVVKYIRVLSIAFSVFMVIARTICGVHWITDIVGSILFSTGAFYLYRWAVSSREKH